VYKFVYGMNGFGFQIPNLTRIVSHCSLSMELVGIDPAVKDQIYKLASSTLCAPVTGQLMTSLMCRGPSPGDVSYASHEAEKKAIFESLKKRAKIVGDGLNAIDGFSCRSPSGAMYCFPSVDMPVGVLREAKSTGVSPDTVYALSLLEYVSLESIASIS
jgi:alanine transaminase